MPGSAFSFRQFANAWNTHDVERILGFYAEDAELVDPNTPTPVVGKDAIRRNVQTYLRAFPDLNADVAWSTESEGHVAALTNVTGTHSGDLDFGQGRKVAATNKRVSYRLGVFLDVDANGKIKREMDLADMTGIYAQLGLSGASIPMPSSSMSGGTPRR